MAPMIEDDFVPTLSDDDQVSDEGEEQAEAVAQAKSTKRKREEKKTANPVKKRKTHEVEDEEALNDGDSDKDSDLISDFDFDNTDRAAALGDFDGWALGGDANGNTTANDGLDAILARRRTKLQDDGDDGPTEEAHDSEDEELFDDDEEAAPSDGTDSGADIEDLEARSDEGETLSADGLAGDDEEADDFAAPAAHPDDVGSEEDTASEGDAIEAQKQKAFFAPEVAMSKSHAVDGQPTFSSMSLSRPIMKGLSEVGFSTPTPIQHKTIPVALEGKDIVGGAVTGSGKTAAFLIPILERLLYRPKRVATTRVAILMPTRELALQCLTVAKKLAAFTDVTFGRAIGGLNAREQEKELKLRPDIVIATPGRFIDFMRNSSSFQTDKVEILVLDEADRMLEEGFADELNEILDTIPKSRQTMLFSATMTSRVDDLIRVGLQRPVRLMVDAQKATTSGLVQEFVRLRPGRESKRLGCLMYLCSTVHSGRAVVFFRQKKDAHRIRVVFGLCGLKAAELHGSMSQEQRIQAIESFRSGHAPFLLATDLASRGLDIKGIETVINYEAPQTHEIYLHRVGRTARAGRKGTSCTLAAEPDRKVVKAAVKAAKSQGAVVRQRTIDPKDADAWQARCDALEDEIEDVLREEKEEKALQVTERAINRAENVVKYEDEIKARPRKTWFQSEKEKESAKRKGGEVLNGPADGEDGAGKAQRGKGGKLSNKKKKRLQDTDDRRTGKEWKKKKAAPAVPVKKGKGGKKRS